MTPDADTDDHVVEIEDALVRPGTYFNPQTEVVVVVDDSTSIDQEIFNMEAYEGADWVRITDEVADRRGGARHRARALPDPLPPGPGRIGLGDRARAGRPEENEGEDGQEPGRED